MDDKKLDKLVKEIIDEVLEETTCEQENSHDGWYRLTPEICDDEKFEQLIESIKEKLRESYDR